MHARLAKGRIDHAAVEDDRCVECLGHRAAAARHLQFQRHARGPHEPHFARCIGDQPSRKNRAAAHGFSDHFHTGVVDVVAVDDARDYDSRLVTGTRQCTIAFSNADRELTRRPQNLHLHAADLKAIGVSLYSHFIDGRANSAHREGDRRRPGRQGHRGRKTDRAGGASRPQNKADS